MATGSAQLPPELDAEARVLTGRWGWYLIGGLAVLVVGLMLLFDLFTAAKTLALLVAIALAFEGIDQIVNAPRYRVRWPAYALGVIYVAAAVVAAAWPGITLWALAVVVGISFIITGAGELLTVLFFHRELPNDWVFVFMGALSVLVGVLAIAWPGATILVLAVFLGIRVTIQGLSLILFALGLRQVHQSLSPA
jgi:uncharacterized membrane protein HdeD (DUF308 family)